MNGYVLAWMAVSSGPSMAAGLLLGRKLQHRDSYGSGFESGRVIGEYTRQTGGQSASARLAELRESAGPNPHGHSGPCSQDRGCW